MSENKLFPIEPSKEQLAVRARVLIQGSNSYDFDPTFKPYDPNSPLSVHTTAEMLHCIENHKESELDARILCATPTGLKIKQLGKKKFREAYLRGPDSKKLKRFKELDAFARDQNLTPGIGDDFTPLLGGAFYKNLYYYQDYIRMHAQAFYAYHHDPIAKAIVHITRDFVIGTGYEVQCDLNDKRGKLALATWKAFEEANDLQQQMDDCTCELSIYGEIMWWELPDQQTKLIYNLPLGEKPPTGVIPRIRLMDPSMFVEIVTYPEDISRKLFYVILVPTQYQIYGGLSYSGPSGIEGTGTNTNFSAPPQPTLKFLYQQIPAAQIRHYKINSVSNEKRGRSDLYPVLGYLKRIRDSVDYSIIALQKVSAWAMDTTIEGSQTDVDQYVMNQAAMGTIPPAGSEFVHTKAITRQYHGNQNAGGHTSDAFQWCVSMVAAGVQIPISYFGMHLSGSSTRANAIIGTEPVAKKMEKRREVIKRIIKDLWSLCMARAGIPDVDCEVIFPEIITQDRSQKLKDLMLCEEGRWFSPKRAATMAAKEMQISDFDYNKEIEEMKAQLPEIPLPLLDPGTSQNPLGDDQQDPGPENSMTSTDRKDIKHDDSSL